MTGDERDKGSTRRTRRHGGGAEKEKGRIRLRVKRSARLQGVGVIGVISVIGVYPVHR